MLVRSFVVPADSKNVAFYCRQGHFEPPLAEAMVDLCAAALPFTVVEGASNIAEDFRDIWLRLRDDFEFLYVPVLYE